MSETTTGQCLCGAVTFEGHGPVTKLDACHCDMCRQLNAGPFMGVGFHDGLTVTNGKALKWYDSSDWARRGFCAECGSALFYNLKGSDFYSVSSGCIDIPDGMTLGHEFFIDQKPDFYALAGDRPRLTAAEVFASVQEDQPND